MIVYFDHGNSKIMETLPHVKRILLQMMFYLRASAFICGFMSNNIDSLREKGAVRIN